VLGDGSVGRNGEVYVYDQRSKRLCEIMPPHCELRVRRCVREIFAMFIANALCLVLNLVVTMTCVIMALLFGYLLYVLLCVSVCVCVRALSLSLLTLLCRTQRSVGAADDASVPIGYFSNFQALWQLSVRTGDVGRDAFARGADKAETYIDIESGVLCVHACVVLF
jgi:hypothetical protein